MSNSLAFRRLSACFLLALATATPSLADVRMPAIFSSHMVLQQDLKIPIWGWADPGEAVTVTLGAETGKATADATGKWRVDLAPVKTMATATTLTIAGKNSLKFDDVLVGDVWICSGQSNMEFSVGGPPIGYGRAHNADTEIPKADHPQIRFFTVAPQNRARSGR